MCLEYLPTKLSTIKLENKRIVFNFPTGQATVKTSLMASRKVVREKSQEKWGKSFVGRSELC
ncbi:hypothetical protein, partial [Klebsiella pneumoniae]|uniref:hypothetical protein n=1 Tax=Klebsiella pneumoniae TaxID=573 RepID=UPI0040554E4F